MTEVDSLADKDVEDLPSEALAVSPSAITRRPKLTLTYLNNIIQSIQEEQRNLSLRVDELMNALEDAPWKDYGTPQQASSSAQSNETLLLELQEAARIAEEIATHAAAQEVAVHAAQVDSDRASSPPAQSANESEPTENQPIKPAVEPEPPAILVSRAERHKRPQRRSLWSKLFSR